MSTNIKQELIDKICATEDENLLMLLKTDYDYFKGNSDVTDELSSEDKNELIYLVSEPFGKDTISQKEFDEALNQWRTK